jgi:hypothetical protein
MNAIGVRSSIDELTSADASTAVRFTDPLPAPREAGEMCGTVQQRVLPGDIRRSLQE